MNSYVDLLNSHFSPIAELLLPDEDEMEIVNSQFISIKKALTYLLPFCSEAKIFGSLSRKTAISSKYNQTLDVDILITYYDPDPVLQRMHSWPIIDTSMYDESTKVLYEKLLGNSGDFDTFCDYLVKALRQYGFEDTYVDLPSIVIPFHEGKISFDLNFALQLSNNGFVLKFRNYELASKYPHLTERYRDCPAIKSSASINEKKKYNAFDRPLPLQHSAKLG